MCLRFVYMPVISVLSWVRLARRPDIWKEKKSVARITSACEASSAPGPTRRPPPPGIQQAYRNEIAHKTVPELEVDETFEWLGLLSLLMRKVDACTLATPPSAAAVYMSLQSRRVEPRQERRDWAWPSSRGRTVPKR